jgi:hypothetical protein
VALSELVLGHTIPPGSQVAAVTLDGEPADYRIRDTNRGREVLVTVPGDESGRHVLVVTAG